MKLPIGKAITAACLLSGAITAAHAQPVPNQSVWRGELSCPKGIRNGRELILPQPHALDIILVGRSTWADVGYVYAYPDARNEKMKPFCYPIVVEDGTADATPLGRSGKPPYATLKLHGRLSAGGRLWSGTASGNFLSQCAVFSVRKVSVPLTVPTTCHGTAQDIGQLMTRRTEIRRKLLLWIDTYASAAEVRDVNIDKCQIEFAGKAIA